MNLLEEVTIIGLENQPAIVTAILHRKEETSYEVVYWYNGERKAIWCYEFELEVFRKH